MTRARYTSRHAIALEIEYHADGRPHTELVKLSALPPKGFKNLIARCMQNEPRWVELTAGESAVWGVKDYE